MTNVQPSKVITMHSKLNTQRLALARLLREEGHKVLLFKWMYGAGASSFSRVEKEDLQRLANRVRHS